MTNPSKNSFLIFIAFFAGSLFNYIFNVVMGWMLTPEQFGMIGVSTSFFLILSLFVTSAFPLTVTKFISGEDDEILKHRVFKSSLAINTAISLILSLFFYICYETNIMDLGVKYKPLIICIIFATIFSAISVMYNSILRGTFRFKAVATIQIVNVFAKLFSGVILVWMGFGALGAVLSFPISAFVGLMLTFILTKDFNFWKTRGWPDAGVYLFAFPMFFGTLGTTLLTNIDILGVKFLTEGILSDTLSGYYRAALVLAQLPVFLAIALMSVMFPYISKHGENERYSLKSIKYGALFILPFTLLIAIIPDAFISLMFPEEYLAGAQALSVSSIGMGFLVMGIVFTNIFQAKGTPKIPAIVLSVAVIIEIILLIELIPLYDILGAATSTTLACLFGFAVLGGLYLRMYGLNLNYRVMGKTVLSFCIPLFSIYVFPHSNVYLLFLDLIFGGVLYIFLLAAFKLLTEEDIEIFLSGMPDHKAFVIIIELISNYVKKLNKA